MTESALGVIEREHEVLADEVLKDLVRRTAEHVSSEHSVLYPVVEPRQIGGAELVADMPALVGVCVWRGPRRRGGRGTFPASDPPAHW